MTAAPDPSTIRFVLADLDEQVEAFWQRFPDSRADDAGEGFASAGADARLQLPLAAPRARPGERVGDYAERLAPDDEVQLVLLLRRCPLSWRPDGARGFWRWRAPVSGRCRRRLRTSRAHVDGG